MRIWISGWGLAESGSFRDHGLKQEIIALTFCFFFICSTSPPGGNQVDGLPPAASLEDLGVSKLMNLEIYEKVWLRIFFLR